MRAVEALGLDSRAPPCLPGLWLRERRSSASRRGLRKPWSCRCSSPASCSPVALTADRPGNPLAARPVYYLGEISYSTYFVHFLLYILFKILLVDDPANVPPILIGFFLLLTLMASAALYHGVERPAQRALNRLFDRRLARRPVLSAAE